MSTAKVTPEQAVAALEQVPPPQRDSFWKRLKKKFSSGEPVPARIRDPQDPAVDAVPWWETFQNALKSIREGVTAPFDAVHDVFARRRLRRGRFFGGRKTQKVRRHRKSTRRHRT